MPIFHLTQFAKSLIHRISDVAKNISKQNYHSATAWRNELMSDNVPSMDLPESLGGLGLPSFDVACLNYILGELSIDLRDVPGLAHGRFLHCAAPGKYDDLLKRVSQCKASITILSTEPNAGTNRNLMETIAVKSGCVYIIDGVKDFVARHRQATHFVVLSKVTGVAGLSAFLVKSDAPGLSFEDREAFGLHGVSWGKVTLRNVRITDDNLISHMGSAKQAFDQHFSFWRCNMAACATGAAVGALKLAARHLVSRKGPTGNLSDLSHLQKEMGDHYSRLARNWCFIESALRASDASDPQAIEMSWMCKADAVEDAFDAVDWAFHALGARAYDTLGCDLGKRLRDLQGLRISSGPSASLRCAVGRKFISEHIKTES